MNRSTRNATLSLTSGYRKYVCFLSTFPFFNNALWPSCGNTGPEIEVMGSHAFSACILDCTSPLPPSPRLRGMGSVSAPSNETPPSSPSKKKEASVYYRRAQVKDSTAVEENCPCKSFEIPLALRIRKADSATWLQLAFFGQTDRSFLWRFSL